jgi:uncharacterized membrane protein (UPF0127 family)
MRRAALLLSLTLAACGAAQDTRPPGPSSSSALPLPAASSVPAVLHPIALLSPDGHAMPLRVEYAVTPEDQERGLMGRTSLPPDGGMLFVFPADQDLRFWMKNTLIPLDIAFFDARNAFVSSSIMTPCPPEEATCTVYTSASPAKYALELPAGSLVQRGIGPGWSLAAE